MRNISGLTIDEFDKNLQDLLLNPSVPPGKVHASTAPQALRTALVLALQVLVLRTGKKRECLAPSHPPKGSIVAIDRMVRGLAYRSEASDVLVALEVMSDFFVELATLIS
jgi:hypothetical protein